MKQYVILLAILSLISVGHAQTNSFPTNGNVGIGTTSPQAKLQVSGGGISVTGANTQGGINGFRNFIQLSDPAHAAMVYNPGQTNEMMFGFHSNGHMYWAGPDVYAMHLSKSGDLNVYNSLAIGDPLIKSDAKLQINGGGLSVNGTNTQLAINGFRNFIQLTDPAHAAIVYNPGQANELMFGFHSNGHMYWGSGTAYAMRLASSGHLRIYTSLSIGGDLKSGSKMSVDGRLSAKEVQVTTSNWPDYVFEKDYKLMSLDSVAQFIEENGHLPDMPKAADVEANGVQLGEMVAKLLKKNEELTLHLIEKSSELDKQKKQIDLLSKKIDLLNIVLDEKLDLISLD